MTDWCVGDLAVCVNDDACECCGTFIPNLRKGQVYTVQDIDLWIDGELYLKLAELAPISDAFHSDRSWVDAPSFRKVVKDKHEACEAEFVTLLKRTKRKVEA